MRRDESAGISAATSPLKPMPAWADAVRIASTYLMGDMGGGPRPWKLAWVINFQKAGMFQFRAGLMT